MPSGLAKFVKGQGSDGNGQPTNGKGLSRRAAEGMAAKVKPKDSVFKKPAIPQTLRDHHYAPPAAPYAQPFSGQEQNDGDTFAGSVLSDSDDTTRDLGPSIMRGYQTGSSSPDGQNFRGRNGVRQEVEPAYPTQYYFNGQEERELDYHDDVDAPRDGPDDGDGQSNAFQLGDVLVGVDIDKGQMNQVLQLRDSQEYAEAKHAHERKFGSNNVPFTNPSISGRFVAVSHLPDEVRRDSSTRGGRDGSRRRPYSPRNDQPVLDFEKGYYGDEDVRQADLPQHGGRLGGQVELSTRPRLIAEHGPRGEQDDQDRFRASDPEFEDSDESDQASTLQHTPRAAEQPNRQTSTPSQAGKRKGAEVELDYDIGTLSTMKYAELREQAFDHDPKAPAPHLLPELLSDSQKSLEERLELLKHADPNGQADLFVQMPLDQWEQAGDWFLARFGEILSEFKKARRSKRDVSRAFEEELATREEGVRGSTEGIGEIFRQMRAGGESVLNRKAL